MGRIINRWTGRVVVAGLLLTAASVAGGQEGPAVWPQWRGPTRDCKVGGPKWPESLQGDRLQLLWRVKLGPGYPGPIVAADRVFVAETRDKKDEVVRALDRKTGKELWTAEWAGALSVPFFAKANGDWIRSTPAHDGKNLYVAGMRDVLVCLDGQTGKVRWRFDFVKELGTKLPDFGFVCSPLLDDKAVYVQAGAALVKLDRQSGKLLWRVLEENEGMMSSAFSSPVFATLGGKRQVLVQTRQKLAGVDPESGAVLWTQPVPSFRGMNILTPLAHDGGVFTSSYGGKAFLFRPAVKDGRFDVETAWTNKAQAYMTSPVVVGGHAYLLLKNQRFACIELKTGRECWTTAEGFGQYWSMAVQGDRILALDERGELLLLRANPERFELLDRRKISDAPAWGHLAVCGDEIFVRELNAIAAYRWK